MSLDLAIIAPARRRELVEAGRKFGSELTLSQARRTLDAWATHGGKLEDFGFAQEDAGELSAAHGELVAAGVGREMKRSDKKTQQRAYAAAVKDGQEARTRARSVLGAARRVLARTSTEEESAAVRRIDTALESGSVADDDADRLAMQLDELRAVLGDKAVANATAKRGGPKAIADLEGRAIALRGIAQMATGRRGTPEETERLDLIDGIILELVRSAREAAEAAGKALGEPALMNAFALTELYGGSGGRKAGGAADEEEEGTGGEA